jgi:hypothetical protein
MVYGDIAIVKDSYLGDLLYYSAATISNIGGTGVVGSAGLYRVALPSLTGYSSTYTQNHSSSPIAITVWLYGNFPLPGPGTQIADLGSAYSDTAGDYTMGSWQVEGNDHHLVWQVITGVSTSKQTVSSNFCFAAPGFGCNQVLSGAGNYSQSLHGQLGLSSNASQVAFAGAQLYLQAVNGGNSANQLSSNSWIQTPVLTNSPSLVVATQIISSSRDSNGVLRTNTDLVAFDGQNHYVLIVGAEDASWK